MRAGGAGSVRRSAVPWGQGLACGVLVMLATPTAVLAAGMLAPAIAMALFDAEPGKPVARALLLSGLAAAVGPLAALWTGGHTLDLAWTLLADPRTLLLAWAAQGGGWLLAETLPLLIGVAQRAQAAHRRAALLAERARLQEEWGLDAAGAEAPPQPPPKA